MGFYDKLALYYDDLFPAEKSIISFLDEEFDDSKNLLDVACGTGTYALLLAESGRKVSGADLDPGMIDLAREKTVKAGPAGSVEFITADMTDLQGLPGAPYDGLSCLGNSLVHLSDVEEIERALAEFAAVLVPGGRMVLQIVNFDRVLVKTVAELPALRGKRAELKRRYKPSGDGVHFFFETELVLKGSDERGAAVEKNSVPLYPLKSGRLVEAAARSGFGGMMLLGSFDRTPYIAEESFLTILTAERSRLLP